MKILFFNGDSHTAGAEMEYEMQPECKHMAWPKILSDKIGVPHVNIAKSGASNQYIFRTTQDWVIENIIINKVYKPEDVFVTIMWTGFDRQEIYFHDTNIIDNINPLATPDFFHTKMISELTNLQKTMVDFSDNLFVDFKALTIVYNMSFWLDSIGIKHRFINGIYHFPEINYLNYEYRKHAYYNSYKNLLLAYGDDKIKNHVGFSDNNETYYTHMKMYSKIPLPEYSKFQHWGEDGHKYWSNRIYELFYIHDKNANKKLI
jgi:hypothetical protein